jgi:hypothetical protein
VAGFAMARATNRDAKAEIDLLASYLRQPGSARAFSRTVRDVIRWRGQTRTLFDRIADVAELPPMRLFWGESATRAEGVRSFSKRTGRCSLVGRRCVDMCVHSSRIERDMKIARFARNAVIAVLAWRLMVRRRAAIARERRVRRIAPLLIAAGGAGAILAARPLILGRGRRRSDVARRESNP